MRSSILLTSALAMGALAGPLRKRVLVTEIDLEVVTTTIYVTPGQQIMNPDATAQAQSGYQYTRHSHKTKPTTTSCTTTSTSAPAPPPTSTQPVETSSEVYTPPTTSTTPAPTTYVASTPTPTPTSSSSSSSQAPASSSAAQYGVDHVSGVVQATFSSGADYQKALLWHHNRARANHGAGNLEWSTECEDGARAAAAYCDFTHHTTDGQGQNLFTVSGDAYNVTGGVTDSWYKGEADIYSWWGQEPPHDDTTGGLDMDYFEKYGHATQMLWKGTTHVGCITIDCGSKMTVGGKPSDMSKYTVCNYSPPGNYINEFAKNVQAPAGSYAGYHWSD